MFLILNPWTKEHYTYRPALVTIISVPRLLNSSQRLLISSCTVTPETHWFFLANWELTPCFAAPSTSYCSNSGVVASRHGAPTGFGEKGQPSDVSTLRLAAMNAGDGEKENWHNGYIMTMYEHRRLPYNESDLCSMLSAQTESSFIRFQTRGHS